MNTTQGYTLAALLAVLVGASVYQTKRGTLPGIRPNVGVTIVGESGKAVPAAGVPIVLPAGPSGKTYWPIRGLKFPHATGFLDAGYHAGYPDAQGRVSGENKYIVGYWHTGIDMNGPGACCADQGDALHAIRDGVIEWCGTGSGSWSKIVVLEFTVEGKKYWARYGHIQTTGKTGATVQVKAGQVVKAHDVIAFIGKGSWLCSHLHLDIFHTKPPRWDWWPTKNGPQSEVTKYCTDGDAFLRRLGALPA